MKYIVIASFLLSLLASCSPQKRFQRLIEKHPELIKELDTKVTIRDTIVKTDTIFIKGKTVEVKTNVDSLIRKYTQIYDDSLVSISVSLDSLKQLKTKVHIKDRFFARTDTIYYEKEVIVPAKMIENKNWMYAFIVSWIVIIGLTALYWRK
jgi:uncharacterized protein YdcH (DUF465 family)